MHVLVKTLTPAFRLLLKRASKKLGTFRGFVSVIRTVVYCCLLCDLSSFDSKLFNPTPTCRRIVRGCNAVSASAFVRSGASVLGDQGSMGKHMEHEMETGDLQGHI